MYLTMGTAPRRRSPTRYVSTYRTHILPNGRLSIFVPVLTHWLWRKLPGDDHNSRSRIKDTFVNGYFDDELAKNNFARTENDDKPGMSMKDIYSLSNKRTWKRMTLEIGPHPCRSIAKWKPCLKVAERLIRDWNKEENRWTGSHWRNKQYFAFMKNLSEKGHAELASKIDPFLRHLTR